MTAPSRAESAPPAGVPTKSSAAAAPVSGDVLSAADVGRTLSRIAHQVFERTEGGRDLVLLGIPTRGVALAYRLAAKLAEFEGLTVSVGSLDTTMYRDDLRLRGIRPVGRTELPGTVDDKVVVLVDDVLYSGRTVRAALDALSDLGRPRAVQLAVLVDRGHRELPIRADYVGKNLPTNQGEKVRVLLQEVDGRDGVLIERRAGADPPPAAQGSRAAQGSPAAPGEA